MFHAVMERKWMRRTSAAQQIASMGTFQGAADAVGQRMGWIGLVPVG